MVLLGRHQIFCGLDRERLLQNLPTPEIRLHRCCFADVVLAFTDQFGRVLQHSGEIGERLRGVLGDLTATLFGSCRSVFPSTAQRHPSQSPSTTFRANLRFIIFMLRALRQSPFASSGRTFGSPLVRSAARPVMSSLRSSKPRCRAPSVFASPSPADLRQRFQVSAFSIFKLFRSTACPVLSLRSEQPLFLT